MRTVVFHETCNWFDISICLVTVAKHALCDCASFFPRDSGNALKQVKECYLKTIFTFFKLIDCFFGLDWCGLSWMSLYKCVSKRLIKVISAAIPCQSRKLKQ